MFASPEHRFSQAVPDVSISPATLAWGFTAELQSYFQAFARRNDLYKLIQFDTELGSATWDDDAGIWHLKVRRGEELTTRYLVAAIGILHKPNVPEIPGLETFRGKAVHSSQWTSEPDEYVSKRIAVIGTGASGVQLVGALSETVEHLTHFVRKAQYVIPAQILPVGPEERTLINARYDRIWTDIFTSAVAMGFVEPNRTTLSVSPEDRERIFEELWRQGSGFRSLFGGFIDLASDEAANEDAIKFIHRRMREIVKDPKKAEVLTSSDWFARRPLTDDRFYGAFNQDNVAAVDLKKTPIEAVTPEGIKTSDGKVHEVDLIVFATGFDSVDGSYYRTANFQNLFLVNGPGGPFANNPPVAENTARFGSELIARSEKLRKNGSGDGVVESTPEADAKWKEATIQVGEQPLFSKTPSWFFGENIAGRKKSPRFWFGGVARWRAAYAESKANNDAGFKFSSFCHQYTKQNSTEICDFHALL